MKRVSPNGKGLSAQVQHQLPAAVVPAWTTQVLDPIIRQVPGLKSTYQASREKPQVFQHYTLYLSDTYFHQVCLRARARTMYLPLAPGDHNDNPCNPKSCYLLCSRCLGAFLGTRLTCSHVFFDLLDFCPPLQPG